MADVLYNDNDNLIEIRNLTDEVTGGFLNNATASAKLQTEAEVDVAGLTNIPLVKVVGDSTGWYRGTIDDAAITKANVPPGDYVCIVNADEGGIKFHKEILVPVKVRR